MTDYQTDYQVVTAVLRSLGYMGFSGLLGILLWVLASIGLTTIANRRGLRNGWLSWLPVGYDWTIGNIADQYRYLARGEVRSRRKALLALSIVNFIMNAIVVVVGVGAIFNVLLHAIAADIDTILYAALSSLGSVIVVAVVNLGVGIALFVLRCIALYDVYASTSLGDETLFLVLTILFPVTRPFFLFCNRNKDTGMPRRQPDHLADHEHPPVEF